MKINQEKKIKSSKRFLNFCLQDKLTVFQQVELPPPLGAGRKIFTFGNTTKVHKQNLIDDAYSVTKKNTKLEINRITFRREM